MAVHHPHPAEIIESLSATIEENGIGRAIKALLDAAAAEIREHEDAHNVTYVAIENATLADIEHDYRVSASARTNDEATSAMFGVVAAVADALHLDEPGPRITRRELEVARMVAKGMADKEIAKVLYVSPRTVQAHIRNATTKVGVNNRTLLARYIIDNHLEETI